MLTKEEYKQWLLDNKISEDTRKVIDRVRSSQPARRVRSTRYSMAGRYSSRKMMVVIQFESHTIELPVIYELEFDPDVLEYYDQPPSTKLRFRNCKGKIGGYIYTADFFVIRKKGAGWIECKYEKQLEKLAQKPTKRFVRDADGKWIFLPGQEYASKYDLTFIVRSSKETSKPYFRNLMFLEDYYHEKDKTCL